MVDLDCVESAQSPPPAADNMTCPPQLPIQAKQLCRLCLQDADEDKVLDIFADENLDEAGNKSLVKIMYELFQIKYDRNYGSLPRNICQRCLEMVRAFDSFRQIVQQCEEKLQKRLELIKSNAFLQDFEDKRPGLNGNPGIFEPEDDCEIERINPDQEFESSEDDFSMESDSETEENTKQPQADVDSLIQQQNPPTPINTSQPTQSVPLANDAPQSKDTTGILSEHKKLEFTITNTYLCQYCDMAFTTQPECLQHESGHDSNMPYVCNFCLQHYNNRQALIGHIKEVHDPEKPYICALCSKGFCRRSDLKKHTIVHTGVRPFSCPLCTKSFSRNTNLYKHMRIHSSIKPYVCQQCPRSFTTGTELLRHARTHSEIKNFKCSKCPATYARKDKLQTHEQTHHRKETEMAPNQNARVLGNFQSEELLDNIAMPMNPFIQSELNQLKPVDEQQRLLFPNSNFPHQPVFPQLQASIPSIISNAQPPTLQKPMPPAKSSHPRIHTCDICAKSFTRERDFHRHQALHLDTLFTCKLCGLGFSRREKLARHELEHHGPQYPCDICRITFHKKDDLDMHVKMHELQQNAALSAHQAVLNAAGVVLAPPIELPQMHLASQPLSILPTPKLAVVPLPPPQRPSAADISFYSQMVPTMNLGFYSETRPEDRNAI